MQADAALGRAIRIGSDVAVGMFAAWTLKQLGWRQGTLPAFLLVAVMHDLFDAPVATFLEERI
ncbi:MAG TPA: hypothetical protein VHJ34_09225 [Actinomycetota bacterium]|nr:hypothetical protein [Actinomycetota bacterium]